METDIISARAKSNIVTLTNTSNDPVYYFIADQEALALLDWAVCRDPSTCVNIPSGKSATIAFSQIAAYQPGSGAAVVYHWKLVPAQGGSYKPDSIRQVTVPLK